MGRQPRDLLSTLRQVLFSFAVLALDNGVSCAAGVVFGKEIQHLFKEKCVFCHGPLKQEGGLRLDAASLIVKGGDSGSAVSIDQPLQSLLLQRVIAEGAEQMPPEGEGERLTNQESELLRAWIAAGAPVPANERIINGPQDHWAYQVPASVAPPEVADKVWQNHPVDRFVSQQHHLAGLKPVEIADKRTLLRRVSLDLIGLPPTVDEMESFLADESPDAYQKVVDRLLASPHYGERWGRHWMDVWRYSDWDGYKQMVRGSQRHIWRWREWIVNSINQDKGYDQMIREMIAGDELYPGDASALDATGFLARNYHNANREIWMDSVVEHTAKAFLGMTLNCARCHDHKYDPLTQVDYFRFRAIFEPYDVRLDRVEGTRDLTKAGIPHVYDAHLDRETYLFEAGDERRPVKDKPIPPGVPSFFKYDLPVAPVALPEDIWANGLRKFIEEEDLTAYGKNITASEEKLNGLKAKEVSGSELRQAELKVESDKAILESLTARWTADRAKYLDKKTEEEFEPLARAAAKAERASNVILARIAVLDNEIALEKARQKPEAEGAEALIKKAEETLATSQAELEKKIKLTEEESKEYASVAKIFPQQSTGRRAALANWLSSPENALTARVAVNHVWLRHFGQPLVPNVVDFGLSTDRPDLADLLDWLSAEFVKGDATYGPWSFKHLHRLIVTSRTYQLSSHADESYAASVKADPECRLFWKRQPLRLESEGIRDSVLAVTGNLDVTAGGEDLDFNDGDSILRRSIYFRTAYEKQMLLMTLFDTASPSECYRRSPSVIPQQALALANSPFTASQARVLAGKIFQESQTQPEPDQAFVQMAFERVLNRPATEEELKTCVKFLTSQSQRLSDTTKMSLIQGGPAQKLAASSDPDQRSRENLIHVLFNHSDFVTIR